MRGAAPTEAARRLLGTRRARLARGRRGRLVVVVAAELVVVHLHDLLHRRLESLLVEPHLDERREVHRVEVGVGQQPGAREDLGAGEVRPNGGALGTIVVMAGLRRVEKYSWT